MNDQLDQDPNQVPDSRAAEEIAVSTKNQQSVNFTKDKPKRGFWKRAWYGEQKLWKAFWVYGLLGIILYGTSFALFFATGLMEKSTIEPPVWLVVVSSVAKLMLLSYLAYIVWWSVSVWRSAWNASSKIWGYFARVFVAGYWLLNLFNIGRLVYALAFS
jgi:hypothetical protein